VAKLHIQTSINDETVDFLCEPAETLLDVLRNRLNLTGTKEGCSTGDCGACSVLINDRLVPSCLVLAPEVDDQRVLTIEGVATGEALHPVQQKLLEHAALQCGICTPGIVVAAKALLDRIPDPSETEVRFWLAGNLCRCTGYDKIVRAVMEAGESIRAAQSLPADEGKVIA
jgi:carbon-monoxide dehydrogenase small subunit